MVICGAGTLHTCGNFEVDRIFLYSFVISAHIKIIKCRICFKGHRFKLKTYSTVLIIKLLIITLPRYIILPPSIHNWTGKVHRALANLSPVHSHLIFLEQSGKK